MYTIDKASNEPAIYLKDINKCVEEYFNYDIPLSDMDYYQVFSEMFYKGYLVNFDKIFMYFPNGKVTDYKIAITDEHGEIKKYFGKYQDYELEKGNVIIAYNDINNKSVFYKSVVVDNGILEYVLINMITKEEYQYQFLASNFIDQSTGELIMPKLHLDEPINAHYTKNFDRLTHEFWCPITIDKNNMWNYIKAIRSESRNMSEFLKLMEVYFNNDMPILEKYIQFNSININEHYINLPLTNITSKEEYQRFISSQSNTCFDWHITSDMISLYNGTNKNVNDMQSIIKPITLERTRNL